MRFFLIDMNIIEFISDITGLVAPICLVILVAVRRNNTLKNKKIEFVKTDERLFNVLVIIVLSAVILRQIVKRNL